MVGTIAKPSVKALPICCWRLPCLPHMPSAGWRGPTPECAAWSRWHTPWCNAPDVCSWGAQCWAGCGKGRQKTRHSSGWTDPQNLQQHPPEPSSSQNDRNAKTLSLI